MANNCFQIFFYFCHIIHFEKSFRGGRVAVTFCIVVCLVWWTPFFMDLQLNFHLHEILMFVVKLNLLLSALI